MGKKANVVTDLPEGAVECKRCKKARRNQPSCKFCEGKGYLTAAEFAALKGPQGDGQSDSGSSDGSGDGSVL